VEVGDDELVRRAQDGDRDAFGYLAERHQDAVFRFLAGYVGDHHAAEELAQEALLRGYRWIHQLQYSDGARAWLISIARNLARRWLRRHTRRRTVSLPADLQASEGRSATAERFDAVLRALAGLRAADREVVVLFELDGLSYVEIATITGRSEPALRSRLMRARRRLRAILEKTDPGLFEKDTD